MRKMRTDHSRLGVMGSCGKSTLGQGSSPLPFLSLLTRRALLHNISNPNFVLEGESLSCIVIWETKVFFAQSKGVQWI